MLFVQRDAHRPRSVTVTYTLAMAIHQFRFQSRIISLAYIDEQRVSRRIGQIDEPSYEALHRVRPLFRQLPEALSLSL